MLYKMQAGIKGIDNQLNVLIESENRRHNSGNASNQRRKFKTETRNRKTGKGTQGKCKSHMFEKAVAWLVLCSKHKQNFFNYLFIDNLT